MAHINIKKYTIEEAELVWQDGLHNVLSGPLPWWQIDAMTCVKIWMREKDLSIYPHPENRISLSLHEADARSILGHPPTDEMSHFWRQDFDASQQLTATYHFYTTYGLRSPSSFVLRNSNWISFRKLGFGVCDSKRMAMMGLLTGPRVMEELDSKICETWGGKPLSSANVTFA